MTARLSVVIPVWNSAATLADAIDSVVAQDGVETEIICVDDGSSDRSPEIMNRYGSRVAVLRQSNRGPAAARNLGAASSSGEYLLFLDADDFLKPRMLARCASALDAEPSAVLAYVDAAIIDRDKRVTRESSVAANRSRAPEMSDLLAHIWPIVPSTAVIRRTAFVAAGGFNERLRSCEDIHFWLLAREQGRFIFIPDVLVAKTEHSLYPKVLERDPGARDFIILVRDRYGARGAELIGEFRHLKARLLERCAVEAAAAGRSGDARRCLLRALAYEPARLRNYVRFAKSLMTRQSQATQAAGD